MAPLSPESRALAVAIFATTILFPVINATWRLRFAPAPVAPAKRTFTPGDAIIAAIAGGTVPQSLCLFLWPIWPELLTTVNDIPFLLIPTGFVTLVVSVAALFDWR